MTECYFCGKKFEQYKLTRVVLPKDKHSHEYYAQPMGPQPFGGPKTEWCCEGCLEKVRAVVKEYTQIPYEKL